MSRFLHIGFAFHEGSRTKELEPAFNKALDWVRYAPDCWIVYTNITPRKWLSRLKPMLSSGDHVFIVEIDLKQRSGWLPRDIWGWIKRHEQLP